MDLPLEIHPEGDRALSRGEPVVALESTIFSHLGLPSPHNAAALESCREAIRSHGAVPAVTAVLDGRLRIGLGEGDDGRILGPARKTSARELPVAVAQKWAVGATTVSASLRLAAAAGVRVFATGGIGGVHVGADQSFDISADLAAISTHEVITVCAGPKYFLDLAATLEVLESSGVPVLGYGTDELPAFYSPHSRLAVSARVETPAEVAAIAGSHWALGGGGVLVTVPIPDHAAIARDELDEVLRRALDRAAAEGLRGPAITPVVLEATAALTDGRSIDANLALAANNADVAAQVACSSTSSSW